MKKYILIVMAIVWGKSCLLQLANNLFLFLSSGSLIKAATGTRTRRLMEEVITLTSVLSLPFNSTSHGTSHSQYSISPDGWIELGGSGSATAQSTNHLGSTTRTPEKSLLFGMI
jgi:hypothetical protein